MLTRALKNAYKDSLLWEGRNVERTEWAWWAERTTDLLAAALSDEEARNFDTEWTSSVNPDSVSLTGLAARQQRLFDLIRRVQDVDRPLELQPDFDGRDWLSAR